MKKTAPKEIIIEDLSHDLIPIVGNKKFAVLLHNVLSPDECAEMIDRAEEAGFHDASIYDRRTNQAHRNCTRYISDDAALADNWFERIMHALKDRPALEYKLRSASFASNKNEKLNHAVGINERLRLLRYRQGEFFHSHNDAKFIRGADQGERAGETSYVSVLIYLNHKFKGGTTRFHGNGRQLDVKPRTGSILVHEHNILHSGQRITSGKKYIVRTDVMYSTTVMSGRFGPDPSEVLLSGGVKSSSDASLSTSDESSSRNPSLEIGLQSIIGEVKALRVSGALDTDAGSSKDSAGKEPRVVKGGEENQPKPPMKKRSAWMLYSESVRVELAGMNPEMSAKEVTRVVGLRFKALSLEERVRWQMKAEDDGERYKKELAEYRKKVGPADVGPRSDVTLGDLIKQSKRAGPWYSVV